MSKSIKLIYVASATLAAAYVAKDYAQRNPTYFDGPEKNAVDVVVMGDFPNIVEAYEGLEGCKVKALKEPAAKDDNSAKTKKPTKAEQEAAAKEAEAKRIADERDAKRAEIEGADEAALKEILVGLETEKDGAAHTITAEELDEFDVETLRSMALEAVFIEA
ncbi:hypothetical protein [uncultured Planktomarina sp.]|uniref:hypothetical protein n=1 Tax=uncultured Planktomarina sp. TaxID=1538529 RepID=UPI0032606A52